MSDMRIQCSEEMVGANHSTKADTLNRLVLVEHNTDGTHVASLLISTPKNVPKYEYNDDDAIDIYPLDISINGGIYHISAKLTKTFTGLGNNTWYYVLAEAPGSGTEITTAELSASATPPTWNESLKGWYTGASRCIGFFLTDGSGDILPFRYAVDVFRFHTPVSFRSVGPSGNPISITAIVVGAPSLGRLEVQIHGACKGSSGTGSYLYLGDCDDTTLTHDKNVMAGDGAANQGDGGRGWYLTNTSQQINYLCSSVTYCFVYLQLCAVQFRF